MIRLARPFSAAAHGTLPWFLALSLALHALVLMQGPPRFSSSGAGDPSALDLVVSLQPTSIPEAAGVQPGMLAAHPGADGPAVTGGADARSPAVANAAPATRSGRGESSGTSIMSAVPSLIESIAPFWAMQYGGAPGEVTLPPEVVEDNALGYPTDAPARSRANRVVAAVIVDANGRIEDIVSVEGAPHFVRHATAALRDARFKPAERDGTPVRSYLTLAIDYVPSAPISTAARKP